MSSFFNTFTSFIVGTFVCIGILTVLVVYTCLFICNCGTKVENNLSNHISKNKHKKSLSSIDMLPDVSFNYHTILMISIFISLLYAYGILYITIIHFNHQLLCFLRSLHVIGIFVQRWMVYYYYIYRVNKTFIGTIYQTKKWFIRLLFMYVSIIMIIGISVTAYFGYKRCDDYLMRTILTVFGLFDAIFILYIHTLLIAKLFRLLNIKYSSKVSSLTRKLTILMITLCLSNNIFILGFVTLGYDIFYIVLGIDLIINNICLMLQYIIVKPMYVMCCVCCIRLIPKPTKHDFSLSPEKSRNIPKNSVPNITTTEPVKNDQYIEALPDDLHKIKSHELDEIPEDKACVLSPTITYTVNPASFDDNIDDNIDSTPQPASFDQNNPDKRKSNSEVELDITPNNSVTIQYRADPPQRQPRTKDVNAGDTDEDILRTSFKYIIGIISEIPLDVTGFDIIKKDTNKNIIESTKICARNLRFLGLIK